MKKLLIYCFIISPLCLFAQLDSLTQPTEKPGIYIGVDLLNPALSIFSDKKGFSALVAVPIKQKWNLVAEVGYEKNHFENNVWDVDVKGVFASAGVNYFISQDNFNQNMGYYIGGRLGYSPFQQTINKYVIQGEGLPNIEGSVPEHNASAFWIEPLVGGRVQVFKTPFYVDANVRLKIKVYDTNDEGLDPMVIPGFGLDNNSLSFGVNWAIGYIIAL